MVEVAIGTKNSPFGQEINLLEGDLVLFFPSSLLDHDDPMRFGEVLNVLFHRPIPRSTLGDAIDIVGSGAVGKHSLGGIGLVLVFFWVLVLVFVLGISVLGRPVFVFGTA